MRQTKADTLRDELMNLRRCQNAHNYDYDADIEARIVSVQKALLTLARTARRAKAHRELMYDINGHYGQA